MAECSAEAFYRRYIKLPRPPNDVIFYSQGAIFSVTREQIRKRSLDDYKNLLLLVSLSNDTAAGFFLEWFWYYLLTSDYKPCDTNGNEFVWAASQPIYETFDYRIWSTFLKN